MPHLPLRILDCSKPSLTALIVLLVVAVLLFVIPRVILPWAQSVFLQNPDPAVWADYVGPYDLATVVVAVSAFVTLLLHR